MLSFIRFMVFIVFISVPLTLSTTYSYLCSLARLSVLEAHAKVEVHGKVGLEPIIRNMASQISLVATLEQPEAR